MVIVRGRHYLNGEVYDFYLEDGFIRAITSPAGDRELGGEDCWVVPGLIDIQVNGYLGHDFCSGEITVDDVVCVAEELVNAGVTAFCPTVATNSSVVMEASLRTIALACEKSRVVRERIPAIHLEGPYISPEDGPRGAHEQGAAHLAAFRHAGARPISGPPDDHGRVLVHVDPRQGQGPPRRVRNHTQPDRASGAGGLSALPGR